MSIHSSLRAAGKGKKHRSVLKRYERLRVLRDKNSWNPELSVLGLAKVKVLKVKIKKEKAAAPGAATAPGAAAGAKPAAGASSSPAAAKTEKK